MRSEPETIRSQPVTIRHQPEIIRIIRNHKNHKNVFVGPLSPEVVVIVKYCGTNSRPLASPP